MKTRQGGAHVVRALAAEHGVRLLDDAANRGVQRCMIALEQFEPRDQPWLGAAEDREVVSVLDVMVLLELAEQPAQMAGEPGLESGISRPVVERGLAALLNDRTELPEHGVALQPERGGLPQIGVVGPRLARMKARQNTQLVAKPGRAPRAA